MMVSPGCAKRREAGPNGNSGPIQYTGHLWLGEIEVYYAKNRMYDPRLMRFLTTDPIGVAGGINLYAYVSGDPVNYTDPWGLWQIHSQFGCYTTYSQNVRVSSTSDGVTTVTRDTLYRTERTPGCLENQGFGGNNPFGGGGGGGKGNQQEGDSEKQNEFNCPIPTARDMDPGETGKWQTAFESPGWATAYARISASNSERAAAERFPVSERNFGQRDAWRHFHWSYSMARVMSPGLARDFGNAHEISSPNPVPERNMDLYNNAIGRRAARSSDFAGLGAYQAADLALANGCLQTEP